MSAASPRLDFLVRFRLHLFLPPRPCASRRWPHRPELRSVWKPFLLGPIFAASGLEPRHRSISYSVQGPQHGAGCRTPCGCAKASPFRPPARKISTEQPAWPPVLALVGARTRAGSPPFTRAVYEAEFARAADISERQDARFHPRKLTTLISQKIFLGRRRGGTIKDKIETTDGGRAGARHLRRSLVPWSARSCSGATIESSRRWAGPGAVEH